jgi:hypothetical protein
LATDAPESPTAGGGGAPMRHPEIVDNLEAFLATGLRLADMAALIDADPGMKIYACYRHAMRARNLPLLPFAQVYRAVQYSEIVRPRMQHYTGTEAWEIIASMLFILDQQAALGQREAFLRAWEQCVTSVAPLMCRGL